MTSLIIARKMASLNLSKSEFKKIKGLRIENGKKQSDFARTLKYLIQTQTYNKTCRLCLMTGERLIIDPKNDLDFVSCIKNITGIEVTENDGKPQHLCEVCETVLRSVQQLKQTADITQWRLEQELVMVEEQKQNQKVKLSRQKISKYHGGYFVKRNQSVERVWSCGKCRMTFSNKEEFTEHEALPACVKKNFVCETCGLKVKNISTLKIHMTTHSDERPFQCAHCPHRTRSKYLLATHERAHRGARPLRCAHCPATFTRTSNLASHRRLHFPPAFPCHGCHKSFRFKKMLENHIAAIHSTARPHICSTCEKTFATRARLLRHERKVHKRPLLQCKVKPIILTQ